MQTKAQKETIVKDLTDKLKKIKSAVFADYAGLSVVKLTKLRRELRGQGVDIKVIKKTLVDISLKNAGINDADAKKMPGQLAVITGYDDEVAPAKIVYGFSRKEDKLKILGGILNNAFIDAAGIVGLAKLPSRPELLGKLVGTIAAPMSGMLNVLQGNMRGLVQVLSQIDAKRRPEA